MCLCACICVVVICSAMWKHLYFIIEWKQFSIALSRVWDTASYLQCIVTADSRRNNFSSFLPSTAALTNSTPVTRRSSPNISLTCFLWKLSVWWQQEGLFRHDCCLQIAFKRTDCFLQTVDMGRQKNRDCLSLQWWNYVYGLCDCILYTPSPTCPHIAFISYPIFPSRVCSPCCMEWSNLKALSPPVQSFSPALHSLSDVKLHLIDRSLPVSPFSATLFKLKPRSSISSWSKNGTKGLLDCG